MVQTSDRSERRNCDVSSNDDVGKNVPYFFSVRGFFLAPVRGERPEIPDPSAGVSRLPFGLLVSSAAAVAAVAAVVAAAVDMMEE